jgi:AraC-like DNA-binding protein
MELPENRKIAAILKKAKQGIFISGETKNRVAEIINKTINAVNTERIILLLEMLNIIALSNELTFLSSTSFIQKYDADEAERINDIFKYTIKNFRRKIALIEISKIAHVSPNSFCRYFKSHTKKTFSQFLSEIRIDHACKLLVENKLSISKICFESGFNNFSNFNRYFKIVTGKNPFEYRKTFLKKEL